MHRSYVCVTATDLLGANETSMEELYHSTSEKSKAVYRHIDQLATKHKVNKTIVIG